MKIKEELFCFTGIGTTFGHLRLDEANVGTNKTFVGAVIFSSSVVTLP